MIDIKNRMTSLRHMAESIAETTPPSFLIGLTLLVCIGMALLIMPPPQPTWVRFPASVLVMMPMALVTYNIISSAIRNRNVLARNARKARAANRALIKIAGKLARSEDKYRRIVETTAQGFMLLDTGDRILDCNEALSRMVEIPRQELLGATPHAFASDSMALFVEENMNKLSIGLLSSFEGTLRSRSGREIPVRVNTNRLTDSKGKDLGQVVFFSDMTEAKKAEALREDMERITKHDLKSPLNAIIGLPEVLLMEGDRPDEERKLLEIIMQSGYQMLDMINLSLDLYKMEKGTYQSAQVPVDMAALARRIIAETAPLARAKEVSVALRGQQGKNQDAPFMAMGEELLCYSMLSNCIKNSLEASPGRREVTIALSTTGPRARISIHNLGAVPRSIRSTFFDKYATAGKSDGTGLGTYSARLMARTMGGDISMTTSEAQGTTVTIELPR